MHFQVKSKNPLTLSLEIGQLLALSRCLSFKKLFAFPLSQHIPWLLSSMVDLLKLHARGCLHLYWYDLWRMYKWTEKIALLS